jgi:tetratricopeptide (TPR) repeat protein
MSVRWLVLLLAWCAFAAAAQALRLGEVEFPTSARSKEAQAHFVRGVAALHSFSYPAALEEFRTATRIEPHFAMGYWGEAMAHNHPVWGDAQNTAAGRAALAKIDASFAASERERGYIDAVRLLYGTAEKPARDRAYAQAMAKLHEQYPNDAEAALFYALALMGTGDDKLRLRAGEIALRVFDEKPRHPGAAHYVIHAYDDPQHARIALPAARRYAAIASDSAHALHMPSHTFLQLGMWPEAAESNERAWSASRKRDIHSLHWLTYVYLQQGRYREAEGLVETMRDVLAKYPKHDLERLLHATYIRATMAATFVIETQQWQRAAELLGKPAGEEDPYLAIAESPATFARGLAAAMTGSPEAQKAADSLANLKAPPGADKAPYIADILAAARIQGRLIAAASAAERKRFPTALERVGEAIAAAERTPTPPGPPVLIKPPRELQAEILLQAGRPEGAAQTLEIVLARHKDRARALLAAARAAAAAGSADQAVALYARLARQWHKADAPIPELAEARQEREGAAAAGSSRRE